ncbi:hypothetical protein [Myxococcus xanthus]|uniref:hypothetical protein n=1 Tax=Myxococcus xanthus TaxID=34 RepID=UPI0011260909|nr:hypothetical protein [Myxococcus xanthus]QDE83347.1 hypothetical protein BHS07_18265 [Myxococcus xanthus]
MADHPCYGIDSEALQALRAAVRAQHPRDGVQTAKSCACGAGAGGPAWTPACHALLNLLERSERLQRAESEGGAR